jgi:two-component system cell cycle sensor histidine kinase/response regulator CckA
MKHFEWIKKNSMKCIIAIMLIVTILIGVLLGNICKGYFDIMINNQEEQLLVISKNVATVLETSISRSEDDMEYLVNSVGYIEGEEEYFRTGNKELLQNLIHTYTETHSWEVDNMVLCEDSLDHPLLAVKKVQYEKVSDISIQEDREITLLKNSDNQMFMAISTKDPKDYKLFVMIHLEHLYEELVSYITLGDKGYVMVKDANATIIMHKLSKQIGINAIEDRQELYPSLEINNKSLENMIQNQIIKEEGSEIYESYWWADENPKLVKKIAAYTHANIENGFLIVSAVMDYSAVAKLIINDVMSIVLLSILVVIAITGLMIYIIYSIRRRNIIAKENEYLKELNESLQNLHENERIMAHHQQLQIIGTMTGGIAHEFNNLLTPIMGYAGLMLSGMDQKDNNYEDVSEIYDAAEKAKEIIHQISSLSKQNMDTVFKFVDMKQLLTRVRKMAESVKPDNIEVITRIQSSENGIFGNATQINQVILNLIMNAYHAIGSNQGRVIIEYEEIEKEQLECRCKEWETLETYSGKFAKIVVEDDGCGMDENVILRIFDPFFTTKGSEGIGLGLAIANNIVTAHKGIIYAESMVSIGTKFIIILPLTEKSSQIKEAAKVCTECIDGTNTKVLVVDDNPKILKLLEKGLKSFGYQVKAMRNPIAALEVIKQDAGYHIIITDDSMKDMNGIQLAMNIKQKYPEMPIVIITGMLRKEIIEAKESKVIEEYMVKPIAIDTISEVICNILKKS